jgi:hypothetical protein
MLWATEFVYSEPALFLTGSDVEPECQDVFALAEAFPHGIDRNHAWPSQTFHDEKVGDFTA